MHITIFRLVMNQILIVAFFLHYSCDFPRVPPLHWSIQFLFAVQHEKTSRFPWLVDHSSCNWEMIASGEWGCLFTELGFRVGFSSWIFRIRIFGGCFSVVLHKVLCQWWCTWNLEVFSRWGRKRIAGLIYPSIVLVIVFLTGYSSWHFIEWF